MKSEQYGVVTTFNRRNLFYVPSIDRSGLPLLIPSLFLHWSTTVEEAPSPLVQSRSGTSGPNLFLLQKDDP